MVDRIVAGSPGPAVLDVGCGTGIAARQFQAAGCRVLGIEPDARMAAFARSRGVPVEVATFEGWDPAGRVDDAVVAGTAWHWVDPVVGAVKAAQVLRPGGRLAPFHHVPEIPVVVADAMSAASREVAPDSPLARARLEPGHAMASYRPLFERMADGIRAAGRFTEPEQWEFGWERRYTRDEWLDQVPTFGGMTQLDAQQAARVADRVAHAVDALGGSFTMTYATVVVTAVRLDD